jgi:hypothetical protein
VVIVYVFVNFGYSLQGASNIYIDDRGRTPRPSITLEINGMSFYTGPKINLARGLDVYESQLEMEFKGSDMLHDSTTWNQTWVRMAALKDRK